MRLPVMERGGYIDYIFYINDDKGNRTDYALDNIKAFVRDGYGNIISPLLIKKNGNNFGEFVVFTDSTIDTSNWPLGELYIIIVLHNLVTYKVIELLVVRNIQNTLISEIE